MTKNLNSKKSFKRSGVLSGVTALGLIAGLATPAFATATTDPSAEASAAAKKVNIIASTGLYGDVAKQVGGDHVDVDTILNATDKSPWDYQATKEDKTKIAEADMIVKNGGEYDTFMNNRTSARSSSPKDSDKKASPIVLEATDFVTIADTKDTTESKKATDKATDKSTESAKPTRSSESTDSATPKSTKTPAADSPSESATDIAPAISDAEPVSTTTEDKTASEDKNFFMTFLDNLFGGSGSDIKPSASAVSVVTDKSSAAATDAATETGKATEKPKATETSKAKVETATPSAEATPTKKSTPTRSSEGETTSTELPEEEAAKVTKTESEFVGYDMQAVSALATEIAAKLGKIDKTNAADFTKNAENLHNEITKLTEKTEALKATAGSSAVLTTDNAPFDLLHSLGLSVQTVESSEKEDKKVEAEASAKASAEAKESKEPTVKESSATTKDKSTGSAKPTRSSESTEKSKSTTKDDEKETSESFETHSSSKNSHFLSADDAVALVDAKSVKFVITNDVDTDSSSQKVTKAAAAAQLPVVSFDDEIASDQTYIQWMEKNIETIETALTK